MSTVTPHPPLPTVSVVIPTYNSLRYLSAAIASVQAQRYPPAKVQIVVVDDGSVDGSAEMADVHARSDSRILVLRQPNGGPAAARNRGIAASRGELIAFLDCDDTWEPSKLARQAALYQDDPELGLIHCGCTFVDADGAAVTDWVRRSRTDQGELLLEYFCDFFLITSAIIVPRHCLDAVGHFDESLRIGEDHDLFLRLLARYRVGCIALPLLNRTIRADSLSRQDFDLDAHNDLLILDRFLQAHPEFASQHAERIAARYASYLYEYGYGLLEHGKRPRARTMLLRSLRWQRSRAAITALIRSVMPRAVWRVFRTVH